MTLERSASSSEFPRLANMNWLSRSTALSVPALQTKVMEYPSMLGFRDAFFGLEHLAVSRREGERPRNSLSAGT